MKNIKNKIVKIIKDETPINVKFNEKDIICSIKESQFVEKIEKFIQELLDEEKKGFEMLIVKEMNIAYQEGTPTSRLTSLAVKLNK